MLSGFRVLQTGGGGVCVGGGGGTELLSGCHFEVVSNMFSHLKI